MAGAIRYIKFSGYYDKLYEWRQKTNAISRHKEILKYPTKEVHIPTEYVAENDEENMKIYVGNSKACYFLIISLTDIPFVLDRQCDKNSHDAWKALIEKYEVP